MTVNKLIGLLKKCKEPHKAQVQFEITDERLERYLYHTFHQYQEGPPDVVFYLNKEKLNHAVKEMGH